MSCTAWTWRREALVIALPRLFVVLFNIAQPFVIQSVVENISAEDNKDTRNKGYALVAAVAVVYLGIAVCVKTL